MLSDGQGGVGRSLPIWGSVLLVPLQSLGGGGGGVSLTFGRELGE